MEKTEQSAKTASLQLEALSNTPEYKAYQAQKARFGKLEKQAELENAESNAQFQKDEGFIMRAVRSALSGGGTSVPNAKREQDHILTALEQGITLAVKGSDKFPLEHQYIAEVTVRRA